MIEIVFNFNLSLRYRKAVSIILTPTMTSLIGCFGSEGQGFGSLKLHVKLVCEKI